MFHAPFRRSATLSGIQRSAEMISPSVSSATASAFAPGTLHTSMHSSLARPVSMVLVPAPARTTSFSESPASSAAAPIRVLRTTSASNPGTAPGRSSPVRAGAYRHSWPSPRSRSSRGGGNTSANRIFISLSYLRQGPLDQVFLNEKVGSSAGMVESTMPVSTTGLLPVILQSLSATMPITTIPVVPGGKPIFQ